MRAPRTPWPVPAGLAVGVPVRVADAQTQKRGRLGPAHFPGRTGVIARRNSMAREDRGGLWYVHLHPTRRAGDRVECFWGDELIVLAADGVAAAELS